MKTSTRGQKSHLPQKVAPIPIPLPSEPKPFKPHQVGIYITDPTIDGVMDLLKVKWYSEGKIAEPKLNLAFMYMVRNFGQLAVTPSHENGGLTLDPIRQRKWALLLDTLHVAMPAAKVDDKNALAYWIDFLYETFSDERILQGFIDKHRRAT